MQGTVKYEVLNLSGKSEYFSIFGLITKVAAEMYSNQSRYCNSTIVYLVAPLHFFNTGNLVNYKTTNSSIFAFLQFISSVIGSAVYFFYNKYKSQYTELRVFSKNIRFLVKPSNGGVCFGAQKVLKAVEL